MIPENSFYANGRCASALAFLCCLLVACSPDSAVHWQYGVKEPDGRFSVVFEKPMSREVIYQRVSDLMEDAGVGYVAGIHEMKRDSPGEDGFVWISAHSWYSTQTNDPLQYRATVSYPHVGSDLPSITLVIYYGGTKRLEESDWLKFKRWQDEYIPMAFPNATISIVKHPSAYTAPENVARFAKATGLSPD